MRDTYKHELPMLESEKVDLEGKLKASEALLESVRAERSALEERSRDLETKVSCVEGETGTWRQRVVVSC